MRTRTNGGDVCAGLDPARGDKETTVAKNTKSMGSHRAQRRDERRILAKWVPQGWQNQVAVAIDGTREFDVTRKVLGLKLHDLMLLKDGSRTAATLAWGETFYEQHDGPFRIECEKAVCAYFSVAQVDQITDRMRRAARREWGYGFRR